MSKFLDRQEALLRKIRAYDKAEDERVSSSGDIFSQILARREAPEYRILKKRAERARLAKDKRDLKAYQGRMGGPFSRRLAVAKARRMANRSGSAVVVMRARDNSRDFYVAYEGSALMGRTIDGYYYPD